MFSFRAPVLSATLFLWPATPSYAQDSTRILRVLVVSDSAPLADALIRAGHFSITSDVRGEALLRLLPDRYTVVAAKIGYEPDSTEIEFQDGDTSITMVLVKSTVEVEEITIASTRSGRRIEEQALRVEVLVREEIEEKLLMTPGDISMMLNESGGMRVQNTSPSLGGANLRIQGLRGRYSLLLSDGLPLYGGQAGGLGLLQVPPMDLGQVEVIKGAASALYGSSALGGVINLISRKPDGDRELMLNGTTLGGADAIGWTTRQLGEGLAYTFLASAHRQGRIDRDDDGWTDVPGYERLVLRPRIFWDNSLGRSVFVTAGLTVEDRTGGTVENGLAPDGSPYAEDLNTTRFDVGSVGRFLMGSRWVLTTRASFMTQHHDHAFGSEIENDRHTTGFAEIALGYNTSRTFSIAGVAVQGDRYRNRDLSRFDFTHSIPGVFAHHEWSPNDKVTIAASGRLDHHSEYGTFLNPRFSALLKTVSSWTVRTSAGTGFYGPTPFTEETEVTGLSRLAPLAGLRAEKARNASLDIGGVLGPIEVNGTLFGSLIDGAVQLPGQPRTNGLFELVNADGSTRTWGGELLGRYRRGPWHLTASYTYTRSTEPNPDNPGRREVALTPRHSLGIVVMWEQEDRTRVGMEFYYTGRQALDDNPYRQASKPYVIVGFLLEQRIGRARFFVNMENLTNVRQTNFDRLVLPARAPDGRWTTDAWAPLEGRVINGGVRLSFFKD